MQGTVSPALRRLLAACALLAVTAGATAAELAVAPTRLHFEPGTERVMMQLHNAGPDAITVQAEMLSWEREEGVDRHAPSDAILVSPPIFRIEAGATQIVRLGLRRPPWEDREAAYRLQLRELPVPASAADTPAGLRVLLAVRVPVHVAPRRIHRDALWRPLEGGESGLWLHNVGNVHLRVQGVRLPGGADDARDELALGATLLPGESRAMAIPASRSIPAGLPLELLTDRGPVRANPFNSRP